VIVRLNVICVGISGFRLKGLGRVVVRPVWGFTALFVVGIGLETGWIGFAIGFGGYLD